MEFGLYSQAQFSFLGIEKSNQVHLALTKMKVLVLVELFSQSLFIKFDIGGKLLSSSYVANFKEPLFLSTVVHMRNIPRST